MSKQTLSGLLDQRMIDHRSVSIYAEGLNADSKAVAVATGSGPDGMQFVIDGFLLAQAKREYSSATDSTDFLGWLIDGQWVV